LTLANGNRIEIDADEIEDLEPTPVGALVHCRTGAALTVMQNARTLQARVSAARAAQTAPAESLEQSHPTFRAMETAGNHAGEAKRSRSFGHRTRRLLLGRGSARAFVIGETGRACKAWGKLACHEIGTRGSIERQRGLLTA